MQCWGENPVRGNANALQSGLLRRSPTSKLANVEPAQSAEITSGPFPVRFSYFPSPILTYLVNPFDSRFRSLSRDADFMSLHRPAIVAAVKTLRTGSPVSGWCVQGGSLICCRTSIVSPAVPSSRMTS
jgi:hypothetical protein